MTLAANSQSHVSTSLIDSSSINANREEQEASNIYKTIFDEGLSSSLKESAQMAQEDKRPLTQRKKITLIQNSENAIQTASQALSVQLPRFKKIESISKIRDVTLLVGVVVCSLLPFFIADFPFWAPIVGGIGFGCLTECILSPKRAIVSSSVNQLKSEITFHKTFLWSLEKRSDSHLISDADFDPKDERLPSDLIAHDDSERMQNLLLKNRSDPQAINFQNKLYSSKSLKEISNKYGLIDASTPGHGGHRILASRYSKNTKEFNRDIERNFKDIKFGLMNAKLRLRQCPSGNLQTEIGNYLNDLIPIFDKYGGLSRKNAIAIARLQSMFIHGAYESNAHYQRIFGECERILDQINHHCIELNLLQKKEQIKKYWEQFLTEKSQSLVNHFPTYLLKWGYAQYWDTRLEGIYHQLKDWSNAISLDFQRKKINKAILEINKKALDHNEMNLFELLQKEYNLLEEDYGKLCRQNLPELEKIKKFHELKLAFEKVSMDLNQIGSKDKFENARKIAFRRKAKTFSIRNGSKDEKILIHALKSLDQKLRRSVIVRVIAYMIPFVLAIFAAFYSDNIWIDVGFLLGSIQSSILYFFFKKNHIIKWEERKKMLKFALYLVQNPLLMREKNLPPVPIEVLRVARGLTLPLQKALLLSRALIANQALK